MNNEQLHRLLLSLIFSMMIASSHPVEKYVLAGIGLADWATLTQPPAETPAVKSAMPVAGAKSTPDNQQYNLFDEIMQHKDSPMLKWGILMGDNGISPLLARTLGINSNSKNLPAKHIDLPDTHVEGQTVSRGLLLIWTQDPNHPDFVLLAHTTEQDAVFLRLSPNGDIQSVAYADEKTPWQSRSKALTEPLFSQDKRAWHNCIVNHDCSGK